MVFPKAGVQEGKQTLNVLKASCGTRKYWRSRKYKEEALKRSWEQTERIPPDPNNQF